MGLLDGTRIALLSVNITYNGFKKTIHEEILVFDKSGMVSQLGGVVSLFIGISFFTLFSDCLDFIQKK